MHIRLSWKGWRFYASLTHSVKVMGINSTLGDGKHFLIWDFDDVAEDKVKLALKEVQYRYRLADIYLLNTGLPGYHHAYCFSKLPWEVVVSILIATKHLDHAYFTIGIARGYFTLRFSPKAERKFKPVCILEGYRPSDVNPYKFDAFVEYWTKRK